MGQGKLQVTGISPPQFSLYLSHTPYIPSCTPMHSSQPVPPAPKPMPLRYPFAPTLTKPLAQPNSLMYIPDLRYLKHHSWSSPLTPCRSLPYLAAATTLPASLGLATWGLLPHWLWWFAWITFKSFYQCSMANSYILSMVALVSYSGEILSKWSLRIETSFITSTYIPP